MKTMNYAFIWLFLLFSGAMNAMDPAQNQQNTARHIPIRVNNIITGDANGTVKIWDWYTGRLLFTLPGHNGDNAVMPGITPIHIAAPLVHIPIVRYLVANSGDQNKRILQNNTGF